MFEYVKNKMSAPVLVEPGEYEGVRKIAEKACNDTYLVTGIKPNMISELPKSGDYIVLFATTGRSMLLKQLCDEKKLSLKGVEGKREVYGVRLIENPWEGIRQALVIYGSKKRGTIYGIFSLSEYIGVSPMVFWGDAMPVHKDEILLDARIEKISKEPSVTYRGFFINDEWPCFGTWTCKHYGGFTASMYEHVFELLLRLKGNYLWPAMWSSSFALDGPGEESAKLADMYGVIMGNSHHEPCLRASEEWDIYKGEETTYGTQWNYLTNKKGLLKYWEDGLKRSSRYENIVTIGMRGERDSMMQGTKSLEENIAVLKDIIENQNQLIQAFEEKEKKDLPRLLAIYKEVERYFYGDEQTPGLKEWDGLESVILMLCEDNYGNMRFLPDEEMRKHKGGYGMYYHLDYHGSPVSYEWVNSTPLSKIWEQMTECYEYGVQEVWMVNVGDLKGNEFPLSYFMDLAYDFDAWGTSILDSSDKYTKQWVEKQFAGRITKEQTEELAKILTEGIWLTSLRKPEALDSHIYHPAHYQEADRMLEQVSKIQKRLLRFREELSESCQDAYYSMIYYPLSQAMNLIQMQIYAGKNEHYARQGKKIANRYKDLVSATIEKDRMLAREFAAVFSGKWSGMELGKHIGFRKWNEDGCQYPLRFQVEPFERPRMVVSRQDDTKICVKNYGQLEEIEIRDFLYPVQEVVEIEVANDGIGEFTCQVLSDSVPWISLNWVEKEIAEQELLQITCLKELLPSQEEKHEIFLTDGDTKVKLNVWGKRAKTELFPPMTFYEQDGFAVIHAKHFAEKVVGKRGQWKLLNNFGKTGCGLKAFPVTETFLPGEGPVALYRVAVEQGGSYTMEVWSAPSNPLTGNKGLRFGFCVNDGDIEIKSSVSDSYIAGEPDNEEWSEGVLNQIHITKVNMMLHAGVNEIRMYAIDAGFVLEELILYNNERKVLDSYLGPKESWHTKA